MGTEGPHRRNGYITPFPARVLLAINANQGGGR